MYVKVANGAVEKYPYSTGELRQTNPQTSFPTELSDALLAEWGVYRIATTSPPDHDKINESPEETTPTEVSGVWTQTWVIRPATAQEIAQRIEAIQSDVVSQTQHRLDSFAQERSYDGILSLCTYAACPIQKFAVEGQYGVEIRGATWDKLYEILAEVQAGTRPMPSGYADIEPELPPLAWPV